VVAVRSTGRSARHVQPGPGPFCHLPDAPLDCPSGLQIVAQHRTVLRVQLALKIGSLLGDQVEDTRILFGERLPLLRRVALTEETLEKFARVVLHWQRCGGCAKRDRARVAATEVSITCAATTPAFGGNLKRGKWRVLADVLRRNLVCGHAAIRILALARVNAAQPRPGCDRMHGWADGGL